MLTAVARSPDSPEELLVGDNPAEVSAQFSQQTPFGRGEVNACPVAGRLVGGEIEHQSLGLQGGWHVGVAGHPPERDPNPCHQLIDAERFADVVVGPFVEGFDLVVGLLTRGKDDHRGGGHLPDATQNLDTVKVRQAEVEHDEVGLLFEEGGKGPLAGAGKQDLVVAGAEVNP